MSRCPRGIEAGGGGAIVGEETPASEDCCYLQEERDAAMRGTQILYVMEEGDVEV